MDFFFLSLELLRKLLSGSLEFNLRFICYPGGPLWNRTSSNDRLLRPIITHFPYSEWNNKLTQWIRSRALVTYPASSADGKKSSLSFWQCRESHKHPLCRSSHVSCQAQGPTPYSQSSKSASQLSCLLWWTPHARASCQAVAENLTEEVKRVDRWEQKHTAGSFCWLTDSVAAMFQLLLFSPLNTHKVGVSCQHTPAFSNIHAREKWLSSRSHTNSSGFL